MRKLTKAERAVVYDKITTGILLFLFSSPILIMAYIIIWFLSR